VTSTGNEPIWRAGEAAARPRFPKLTDDLTVDVAVIGGGISGITTALLCKQDGARVAVLERGEVAGGATGYTTAKASALQQTKLSEIRRQHGDEKTAAYARASLEAIDWIGSTVAERGIDCSWERLPDFTYAADEQQLRSVEQAAEAARAAGLSVTTTSDVPVPFEVAGAVRLDGQAQFHPVRYVQALAALLPGEDCHVFERTVVTEVHEGSPCTVTTDDGRTVTAGSVVVCTNYPLLDRGLFFARTLATRSYLVAARLREGAALPGAMAISAGEPTRSVRPYVDADGERWVLVGGEGHSTGADKAQPERYEALERFAREQFDVVDVPYRWSTQDSSPVDRLPYAGPYTPRSRHLFVNGGHQKWGMTNGTACARVVADLIAGRENPYAELLDPNRVSLSAAPQFARAQLHVGAHMIGDRLTPADASSSEEVPAGEARVVRSGLGKVGVHRDDAGGLHAVSLRCTHLGCLVHWNGAERSWDCPCHGSRFGIDGEVLAGPAVEPLERREPPK
jgi:glycine/D-amino acid oxidase-like deaminating enzyme/nitrite reductase/ring-hydroxylating ferredoxin subunit